MFAVSSDVRSPDLETTPLVKEVYPEYVVSPWTSIPVRSGTPAPVVAKLSSAMLEAFKSQAAREYFAKSGLFALNLNEQEVKTLQDAEAVRWRGMAAAAKITPQ